MSNYLTGSLCLSNIPKEVIRKVVCRDGVERAYVNIAVFEKKQPQTFTDNGHSRTYTHSISCAPKKEDRKEGVNYYIADLESRSFAPAAPQPAQTYAPAPMPNAGTASNDDLPF